MTQDGDVRHGGVSRRTALKSAAGLAGGALATGTAAAQSDGPDFGGWFENVSNFDGVVDMTGQSRVTVTVGAEGNNGNLAFGPAAIRVDPGTTVVWEWNGKGGAHNVVASDGSYKSGAPVQGSDVTFEYTFESEGVSKYYCAPHKTLGMKGAVVVGGGGGGGGGAGGRPDFGGWFENVSNFDGVVDMTGQSRVTVTVGAEGNNGNLAFGPAAIRVDPGTTVVWEWNGKGGAHNVVASDGSYSSGNPVVEAGTTFEHTFESEGVSKYYCNPHKTLGMKGAVVVGGGGGASGPTRPTGVPPSLFAFGGVLFALMLSPLIFGAFLRYRYPEGVPENVATGDDESEPAVEAAGPLERVAEHIGHDEFEPTGTLTLVLVYMAILVVMWVFMYFVEFLGGGPTVIG